MPAAGRPVELDLVSVEQGTGVPGGGVRQGPVPSVGAAELSLPRAEVGYGAVAGAAAPAVGFLPADR